MTAVSEKEERWVSAPQFAVGAHSAHLPPGEYSAAETLYCFGVTERSYEVEVEGRGRSRVGPDVVRMHAPGDQICAHFPGGASRGVWFVASGHWTKDVLGDRREQFSRSFVSPPLGLLGAVRTFFARVQREGDALYAEETGAALLESLVNTDAVHRACRTRPVLVRDADALLAQRFDRPLRLQDVAAELNVSFSYLARTYRAATGKRLHAQLSRLRAGEAMRRLADGVDDLTALALDLGYSSHSHFTADFRRLVGVTPSAFRSGSRI